MVGALADWFAVTALFRHPLGIPIPHTAIIPNRKDEIGRTLGEFVETEFLRGDVVRTKLEATAIAARGGEWLRVPAHAERVTAEGSAMASGILQGAQRRRRAGRDRGARPRAPHRPRVGSAPRRMARPARGVRRAPRRRRSRRRQHRHLAGGQSGRLLGTGLTPAAAVGALGRAAAGRRHGLQRGREVRRRGAEPTRSIPPARRSTDTSSASRTTCSTTPRRSGASKTRRSRCSTARACASSPPRCGTRRSRACSPRSPIPRAACDAGRRRRSPRSAIG